MTDPKEAKEAFLRKAAEAYDALVKQAEGANLRNIDWDARESFGALTRAGLGSALAGRGTARQCDCGGTFVFKQNRPTYVLTLLAGSRVDVVAPYYTCDRCWRGMFPLHESMGVDAQHRTARLREAVLFAATLEAYETAASQVLPLLSGIEVSSSALQEAALAETACVEASLSDNSTGLKDDGPLCVGIDGGMVHIDDRWQEVKLGILYNLKDRVEVSTSRRELVARDVVAVHGDPTLLRQQLEPRLVAAGAHERKVLVLGDGAPWIWNLASELLADYVGILDFYHVAEHVSACALALYAEEAVRKDFTETQLERIKEGRLDDVLSALAFRRKPLRGKKRTAVDDLSRYLTNNRERMRYGEYLRLGYPIGSGPVESAVNHVVHQRMKRTGMRWSGQGACAMLALRSLFASTGRWNAHWNAKRIQLAA